MFNSDMSVSGFGTKAIDFFTNKNNKVDFERQQANAGCEIGNMLNQGILRPTEPSAGQHFDIK